MSILIDENTRLIVQGITGREGTFHTEQMLAYGTKVVAVPLRAKDRQYLVFLFSIRLKKQLKQRMPPR